MSIADIEFRKNQTGLFPQLTTGALVDTVIKSNDGNSVVVRLDLGDSYATDGEVSFRRSDPLVRLTSPSGFSQLRRICKIAVPIVLPNGQPTENTVHITMASDPYTPESEIRTLHQLTVQALSQAGAADFWVNGSTSVVPATTTT